MSSSSKPTVVLVPGAWHSPAHYSKVTKLLNARGYPTLDAPYPTCGSADPSSESVSEDAEAIGSQVKSLVGSGREVVMLLHSYGGSPGSAAVVGSSKEDMEKQGKPGGVIGLIFMCAFVAQEGDSMLDKMPENKPRPWQTVTDDRITVNNAKEIFLLDVPTPEDQQAIDMLKHQAYNFMTTKTPAQAWPLPYFNGRRAYLKCTEDQAIPLEAQDAMVQYSGVEWDVGELKASHSPHLSQPEGVVDFVVKMADKFAAK